MNVLSELDYVLPSKEHEVIKIRITNESCLVAYDSPIQILVSNTEKVYQDSFLSQLIGFMGSLIRQIEYKTRNLTSNDGGWLHDQRQGSR